MADDRGPKDLETGKPLSWDDAHSTVEVDGEEILRKYVHWSKDLGRLVKVDRARRMSIDKYYQGKLLKGQKQVVNHLKKGNTTLAIQALPREYVYDPVLLMNANPKTEIGRYLSKLGAQMQAGGDANRAFVVERNKEIDANHKIAVETWNDQQKLRVTEQQVRIDTLTDPDAKADALAEMKRLNLLEPPEKPKPWSWNQTFDPHTPGGTRPRFQGSSVATPEEQEFAAAGKRTIDHGDGTFTTVVTPQVGGDPKTQAHINAHKGGLQFGDRIGHITSTPEEIKAFDASERDLYRDSAAIGFPAGSAEGTIFSGLKGALGSSFANMPIGAARADHPAGQLMNISKGDPRKSEALLNALGIAPGKDVWEGNLRARQASEWGVPRKWYHFLGPQGPVWAGGGQWPYQEPTPSILDSMKKYGTMGTPMMDKETAMLMAQEKAWLEGNLGSMGPYNRSLDPRHTWEMEAVTPKTSPLHHLYQNPALRPLSAEATGGRIQDNTGQTNRNFGTRSLYSPFIGRGAFGMH